MISARLGTGLWPFETRRGAGWHPAQLSRSRPLLCSEAAIGLRLASCCRRVFRGDRRGEMTNGVVGMQRKQVVSDALCVGGRAEDFFPIRAQRLDPRRD